MKRKKILITCQQCGKQVMARTDGSMKFCSQKCVGESQRRRAILTCRTCGIKFEIRNSDLKRKKYCSKKCMIESQKGKRISIKTEFKKGDIPKNKNIPQIQLRNNKRICKICGIEKKIDEFSIAPEYVYNKTYYCKACMAKRAMMRYYLPENIEKCREMSRKRGNKACKSLSNAYIRERLRKMNITNKDITPEMIELKRELLTFHRLFKEVSNGINGRGV